jgi:hypothetical protein
MSEITAKDNIMFAHSVMAGITTMFRENVAEISAHALDNHVSITDESMRTLGIWNSKFKACERVGLIIEVADTISENDEGKVAYIVKKIDASIGLAVKEQNLDAVYLRTLIELKDIFSS